jgi:hypothetical protein
LKKVYKLNEEERKLKVFQMLETQNPVIWVSTLKRKKFMGSSCSSSFESSFSHCNFQRLDYGGDQQKMQVQSNLEKKKGSRGNFLKKKTRTMEI